MAEMGTQSVNVEPEFSALQFEKSLTNLKDSQESINQSCQWCLTNRHHYKKIVNSWLNVIKRVKVEQRLTLFYLANDVVQYSKRRNYDYIETWGTAIQKATTLVRDERVKHKILRIFKIWEQRGVYGEEFIADLCGLISIQPTGPKSDEPHEFQPSYVINKIKNCANLEKDTDTKLKILKEHNPKIQITEGLINSLKDRANVDDVEKEVDVYVQHMESYINALKLEIKSRIALITVLKQSEKQLESDRKDVKMVAHAYRTFGQRVKVFQKKLEERMDQLPSPIPSPDINAPSPSPEEDLDLPDDTPSNTLNNSADNSLEFSATIQYTNPGFYVPPPTSTAHSNIHNSTTNNISGSTANISDTSLSFLSNGFTSFLGSNLSFDVTNISTSGLFSNSLNESSTVDNTQTTNSYVTTPTPAMQPPMPVAAPCIDLTGSNNNSSAVYNPLLPPPAPPFSKSNESGGFSFTTSMDISPTNYASTYPPPSYSEAAYTTETGLGTSLSQDTSTHYDYQLQTGANPFAPTTNDTFETSDMTNTWESVDNPSWKDLNDADTPESPPMFEKEGYGDPVEYHDTSLQSGALDIDQRVIPGMGDLEDSMGSLGGKDVDHRNLISLTGSPNVDRGPEGVSTPAPLSARGNLKTITTQDSLWDNIDRDYRNLMNANNSPPTVEAPPLPPAGEDQDYRLKFNLDGLNLPPPPPPPPKSPDKRGPPLPPVSTSGDPRSMNSKSPRKGDNIDDVDMDLSDDIEPNSGFEDESHLLLEPPPPLPDLLDDVDANQFLDEISNDLNEFSNLSSELNVPDNSDGISAVEGDNHLQNTIHPENDHQIEGSNMHEPNNPDNMEMWSAGGPPLGPPPMNFGMGPMGMGPPPMSSAGYVTGIQRMDVLPRPPGPALLPPQMLDGPLMPSQMPPTPNWMDNQPPPWVLHNNSNPDDNPYLQDDEGGFNYADNNFGDFRMNRGAHNNFRGSFINFNKNDQFHMGAFRGRGRRGIGKRGGWENNWGGRGNNRGGRGGGGQFRPRGFRPRGR